MEAQLLIRVSTGARNARTPPFRCALRFSWSHRSTYVPAYLANGTTLSYAQLAAYFPVAPITATPDRAYPVALGMSMSPATGMVHTINGQAWPNVTPRGSCCSPVGAN